MTEHEAHSPSEAISSENVSDEPGAAAPTSGVFGSTSRPESLPERFWDEDAGCVRTDALVASYLELERVAEQSRSTVPASADEYDITVEHELFESDPEINRQLHAAGFSRDQVQLVYSLAARQLMPMVAEVASEFEAEREVDKLRLEFGGEEQWREAARQIAAWGRGNLPPSVFDVLATSREGVLAMRKMMAANEPRLLGDGASTSGPLSEADLKEMMRDPKYWREQDPNFIGRVTEGFRRIYDE